MINKKEKFLKNYLNYEIFRGSLMKQQNKCIQLYNEEISIINPKENPSKIKPDISNYTNLSPTEINNSNNNIDNSLENNNIYKIRLEQTKDTLMELSKRKWPNVPISKNILELKGNVNYTNYIIIQVFRKKKY